MAQAKPEAETALYRVAVQDVQVPAIYGGVRCRLFYPTSSTYRCWRRHRRLPRDGGGFYWPSVGTRGIARYAGLPGWCGAFIEFVGGHIDCIEDGEMIDMKCGVVVFSHGMGAVIAGYCRLCEEIAKSGKLVVAVEHGEGSALGTVVEVEDGKKKAVYLEGRGRQLRRNQQRRREQTKKRIKEIEGVVLWLRDVTGGEKEVRTAHGKQGVDLKGKLDVEYIDICGHSFGGSASVGFAVDKPEMCRKVCVMDAWLWPMGASWVKEGVGANTELLVIKNELSKMRSSEKLARMIRGENFRGERVLLKGATHHIQTDFSYLLPKFLAERIGLLKDKKYDLGTINHLNNEICREFFSGDWDKFKENLVDDGKYSNEVEFSNL